jgi:hypothetical protein
MLSVLRDNKVAGRILSYLLHVLFIEYGKEGVDLGMLNRLACSKGGVLLSLIWES